MLILERDLQMRGIILTHGCVCRVRVYLDNCCFNRPYDYQSHLMIVLETKAKLKVQEMIISGELEFVASYILEQENDDNPYLERKIAIEDFFKYAVVDIDETQEMPVNNGQKILEVQG